MNKRILISLSVIGVVAAIAIGGTVAYFSDTETSTGNLFAAGSIDLMIDNHCYYNGMECIYDDGEGEYYWDTNKNGILDGEEIAEGNECFCTWNLANLTDELFFDFEDLKPGDWGEDTVSLHVDNNDAWACVTFENMVDDDNDCTEPEAEEGDGSCGPEEGELSDELYFKFWADICDYTVDGYEAFAPAFPGDDIFQPMCDVYLMDDYASAIGSGAVFTLAAPGEYNIFTRVTGEPLIGGETYYIGKVWCFGEIGAVVNGETLVHSWTCNGEPVDNMTQSDSLTGDIIFYAEQARNNPGFSCFP